MISEGGEKLSPEESIAKRVNKKEHTLSLSGDSGIGTLHGSALHRGRHVAALYNERNNNKVGAIDQESVLGYWKRRLCAVAY